ncbi:MAG: HYR domain-containing protein [Bacteroidia bacterium]
MKLKKYSLKCLQQLLFITCLLLIGYNAQAQGCIQLTCPGNITVNQDPGQCSAVVNYSAPTVVDTCCTGPTSLAGYTYLGTFGGHTYFMSLNSLNWPAAKAAAVAAGGQLVSINSAAENTFLTNVAATSFFLIGAFQNHASPDYAEPSGGWEWVDGTLMNFASWAGGEPNNYGGNEDNSEFYGAGYGIWNDLDSNYSEPYCVEFGCSISSVLISGLPSGSAFPTGTSTVTYMATDGLGNQGTCSFTITVADANMPSVLCPGSQSLSMGANCTATLPDYSLGATASSACGLAIVTQSPPPGTSVGNGTTIVTLTVANSTGLSTSCTFNVIVSDITPPSISCPASQTLNLGNTCSASLPDYTTVATKSDNCGVPVVTQSPAAGSPVSAGTTVVTLTATDGAGLTASCSFNVTVADVTPPSISCPVAQTINLGNSCTIALPNYTSLATKSDNCGVPVVTQSPAAGTPVGKGTTAVTLTATDGAGLTASCSFNVTVNDVTPPTVSCPATQVLNLGNSCTVALPNYTSLATKSDNCGVPVITQSPAVGASINKGTTIVTLTATDGAGLTATCSFNVTVVDATPPSISCPGAQILNLGNSCTIALPNYTSLATKSDNCGVPTVTQSPAAVTSVSKGTITVTLTATDAAGLTSSCSFIVTVKDITPPSISCPATQALNLGNNCTIALPNYTTLATKSDNCGVPVITQSPAAGTLKGKGTTTVTLTATDGAGLTATCSFNVNISQDPGSVISYCILAQDEVDLDRNVVNGNVGVWLSGCGRSVNVFDNSTVNGWVKSSMIYVAYGSAVNGTKYFATAPQPTTSSFKYNTQTDPGYDITVPDNYVGVYQLNGNLFRKILVGKNSKVKFTGSGFIYIKELATKNSDNNLKSEVTFNGNTQLVIRRKMELGNRTEFNWNSTYNVKVYVEQDVVMIDQCCKVKASIDVRFHQLSVDVAQSSNHTIMTGQFIAQSVSTEDYVDWNWATYECGSGTARMMDDEVANNGIDIMNTIVYPNPTAGILNVQFNLADDPSFTIRVIDTEGRIVKTISETGFEGVNNRQLDLQDLSKGIYLLDIESKNNQSRSRIIIQ